MRSDHVVLIQVAAWILRQMVCLGSSHDALSSTSRRTLVIDIAHAQPHRELIQFVLPNACTNMEHLHYKNVRIRQTLSYVVVHLVSETCSSNTLRNISMINEYLLVFR